MRGGLDVSDGLAVDAPYSLPNGWQWTNFGAACINRDSERIPVRSADRALRQGEYDYYGASGAIDKIDDYLFDGELLLIGEDGANLVLRSTPIAFIASGRFWVNNHAHVIDSLSSAALRYLAVYVNSIDLKPYLTGIAQPKLNQKRLNSIPVPFPPEAEQGRIVAKVDELMQLCDDLEAGEQARHHVTTSPPACAPHPSTPSRPPKPTTTSTPPGPESTPTGKPSPTTQTASTPSAKPS